MIKTSRYEEKLLIKNSLTKLLPDNYLPTTHQVTHSFVKCYNTVVYSKVI